MIENLLAEFEEMCINFANGHSSAQEVARKREEILTSFRKQQAMIEKMVEHLRYWLPHDKPAPYCLDEPSTDHHEKWHDAREALTAAAPFRARGEG